MANVDKTDMAGVLGALWQFLCDSVSECNGGSLVDQTERVQADHLSSIQNCSTLDIGVPSWNGNDHIRDSLFEFVGGDIPEFAEIGGDELGVGKCSGFPEVVDLEAINWYSPRNEAKRLTFTPTLPFTSTSSALMYFFSNSATSGSFSVRPISLLSDPTVFLKLEVSAVLAASPIKR